MNTEFLSHTQIDRLCVRPILPFNKRVIALIHDIKVRFFGPGNQDLYPFSKKPEIKQK